MIGVVLWKNLNDGSAVIWCEDQGDLAYLNSGAQELSKTAYFDVGDVVEFDVSLNKNMRSAQNLIRMADMTRPALRRVLVLDAAEQIPKQAEVIPFRKSASAADLDCEKTQSTQGQFA